MSDYYKLSSSVARILLLFFSSLFIGCGFGRPGPGEIVIDLPQVPGSIVPGTLPNGSPEAEIGRQLSDLVFDGLTNREYDYQENQFSFVQALATSIEQSADDRREYIVELRDVLWHDGRKLESQDVQFSWFFHTDPENASVVGPLLREFIRSVEPVDTDTVRFIFSEPIPRFRVLSVLSFKILPFRVSSGELYPALRANRIGRDFIANPIGTGPFLFSDYEPQGNLRLTVNDEYFRGSPKIERIVFRPQADIVLRLRDFRRGRTNVLIGLLPSEYNEVDQIEDARFAEYTPFEFWALALRAKGPLAIPENRRAILERIDRRAIVDDYPERAFIMNYGPLPTLAYEKGALYDYGFSPPGPLDASRAPSDIFMSGNQVLQFIYSDDAGRFGRETTEIIASQIAELGFELERRELSLETFRTFVSDRTGYDMALVKYDGFDNLFTQLLDVFGSDGLRNYTGVSSRGLDRALRVWKESPLVQERGPALEIIEEEFAALVPVIPLFSVVHRVYYRDLTNVYVDTGRTFASIEEWAVR